MTGLLSRLIAQGAGAQVLVLVVLAGLLLATGAADGRLLGAQELLGALQVLSPLGAALAVHVLWRRAASRGELLVLPLLGWSPGWWVAATALGSGAVAAGLLGLRLALGGGSPEPVEWMGSLDGELWWRGAHGLVRFGSSVDWWPPVAVRELGLDEALSALPAAAAEVTPTSSPGLLWEQVARVEARSWLWLHSGSPLMAVALGVLAGGLGTGSQRRLVAASTVALGWLGWTAAGALAAGALLPAWGSGAVAAALLACACGVLVRLGQEPSATT